MRDGWRRLPLGEVARLDIDRVPVIAGESYPAAGVLNEGKGLFLRETLSSGDTSYQHLHRLNGGQLVMRKLTAFEGSIGIVPTELEGHFVSPEFPTFTLDASELLPDYMRLICQQPSFWNEMWLRSTGTVQRRKRVNPAALLLIEVDLPPVDEQRRIVDLIASVDSLTNAAESTSKSAAVAARALAQSAFRRAAVQPETLSTVLGEVADLAIGKTPPRDDPRYWTGDLARPFCTIADMNGRHVLPSREGVSALAEIEGKAKRFQAGTLLMSFKLTIGRVGFAAVDLFPNEAIVGITPTQPDLNDQFLALWLATLDLTNGSDLAVKGNTLNGRSLRAIPVIVPTGHEQESIVRSVGAIEKVSESAASFGESAVALRTEMLTDLLSGGHQIPESYDVLLEAV